MNPTEQTSTLPSDPSSPVVGFCRATGKALTADEATYVNGVLYSKEAAETLKLTQEPASPYTVAAPVGSPVTDISPGWAFVLGLIPGVGAIYNQQYAKGLFHIIVFAGIITLVERGGPANVFLGFLLAGWYFYMPFEAFHTAQKRQRGEVIDEVSGLVNLPPNLRRLPIGPVVLIALGVLFLLDNLGLLRIDDVMRFWPILLIAAGVIKLLERFNAMEQPNAD